MNDRRKEHLHPKGPKQRNRPKQLQTHNMLPMMWKILTGQIRDEIYSSQTSRELFPEEQKGCRKGSRGIAELLYILNGSKTRRKILALGWIEKSWTNKQPQNIKNIRWSQKLYRENHENLESGIDSRTKKHSWSKDPKSYISRRCTITVTIHKKRIFQKCRLCCPGWPQNKTEIIWKEG